jgi:hypothetical protein
MTVLNLSRSRMAFAYWVSSGFRTKLTLALRWLAPHVLKAHLCGASARVRSNPSIERTSESSLRELLAAAHVER